MTTLATTFEELCEILEVNPGDYDSAWSKIVEESYKYGSIDNVPLEEYEEFLTESELTALVRVEGLHNRHPDMFGKYGIS